MTAQRGGGDSAVHGVLLLDKPGGITSNQALQKARRLFGGAKAGHTGTLDPLASGLLPICFGEATKFSQALLDSEKTYRAQVHLGWRSTTGDAEGELTPVSIPDVADDQLAAAIAKFTGEISQVPPMYSALKQGGKPLYKLARQGVTVDRAPRTVIIRALNVIARQDDRLTLDVTCSKGTYVRVLAEAIGDELGCGGYLEGLRRTAVAGFRLERAVTLEALEATAAAQRHTLLEPVDALVASLPRLELQRPDSERIRHGQTVSAASGGPAGPIIRLYAADGAFLGLGEIRDDGLVYPKRLVSQSFGQAVSP